MSFGSVDGVNLPPRQEEVPWWVTEGIELVVPRRRPEAQKPEENPAPNANEPDEEYLWPITKPAIVESPPDKGDERSASKPKPARIQSSMMLPDGFDHMAEKAQRKLRREARQARKNAQQFIFLLKKHDIDMPRSAWETRRLLKEYLKDPSAADIGERLRSLSQKPPQKSRAGKAAIKTTERMGKGKKLSSAAVMALALKEADPGHRGPKLASILRRKKDARMDSEGPLSNDERVLLAGIAKNNAASWKAFDLQYNGGRNPNAQRMSARG